MQNDLKHGQNSNKCLFTMKFEHLKKIWDPTVMSELPVCVYKHLYAYYTSMCVYIHILINNWRTISREWNKRVTLKLWESSNRNRSNATAAFTTTGWALPPLWHGCGGAERHAGRLRSSVAFHCWSLPVGPSLSRKRAVFKLCQEDTRDEVRFLAGVNYIYRLYTVLSEFYTGWSQNLLLICHTN